MKGHLFYENTFIERKSKGISSVIRQLQAHPDFQDNLLKLWKLFAPSQNSSIPNSDLENYYILILHLLYPIYPKEDLQTRAKNDLRRLTESSNSDVNFYQFTEFFAKLSFLWLEEVSIQKANLFIDLIYNRTTRKRSIRHGKKQDLNGFMYVTFLLPNFLQDSLSLQRKKKLKENSIFFDETWIEDTESLNKLKEDPDVLIETQLIPYDEVIPIGFAAENIMTALANAHQVKMETPPFGIADPCHRYILDPCRGCPNPLNGTVWTGSKTNLIGEKVESSSTKSFYLLPVIFASKQSNLIVRLNPALERAEVYERLKDKQDRIKYVNVESSFYRFEEYKIDLIHRINLQNEFAQKQGKYFEDTNSNPNKNEKHILSLPEVFLRAIKVRLEFMDLNRDIESTKPPANLSQLTLYKDKELFSEYQSHFRDLPEDPEDVFEEDLLDYANEQPLYILAVGNPKSGVSTLCKSLAERLGVQLISVETFIDALLNKIKDHEENPGDEVDEEGNPIEWMTPIEKSIMENLNEGQVIPQEIIIQLLNAKLAAELTISRGFILDLPMYENTEKTLNWAQRLIHEEIKLPEGGQFSHVIYLENDPIETKVVASKIFENPEDQKISSLYDREIVKKPKPKQYDEDGNEIEEEEDEEKPPVLEEKNLLSRPNEAEELLHDTLNNFQQNFEIIQDNIISKLAPSRYLKIEGSGLNPAEVLETCLGKLKSIVDPLRPVPVKLESVGDDNLKDLLTQSTEETEVTGLPRRQWSAFRTVDPVALYAGKLVVGKGEFPCAYGGRVFLFETEENLNKFYDNPKRYLAKRPEMPKGYNIALLGPRKSGKTEVAQLLSDRYGWKIVNVEEIIRKKILDQKVWETHLASNPKTGSIHPSEEEYKEVKKGGLLPGADVLPIVLHELGFPIWKRPPKPKTAEELEAEAIAEAEEVERKRLEEEKAKKTTKKETKKEREERERLEREKAEEERRIQEEREARIAAGLPEEPEERPPSPPPEDLKLNLLGVQPNEEGVFPNVTGFIFVGYPQTEEHINALKEHNIVINRIIYLVDNSEETGAALMKKGDYKSQFVLETELERAEKTLGLVKEAFGDDIVREVPITFGPQEFVNQILWAVDPFYINVDPENDVVAAGDVGEDDEPVKWADCGPFCPITLADEGWLLPGKEDQEVQVREKRYRFFSEDQLNKFKLNVEAYVNKVNRNAVKLPGPRVLFMGIKGSGVHTQMALLQKQYRVSRVELADEMLKVLGEEKLKRKKQRELMRGFKPKEFDDEGVEIEDPETAEDPSDFDLKAHEIETLQQILAGRNEMLINANMFDVEEGKISTGLTELMSDGRRLPEVCVFVRCTEDNMVKRIFKKQEIVDKYNAIMDERKKKFDQGKAEKMEELLKQKTEEAAAVEAERRAELEQAAEEGEEVEEYVPEPVEITEEEIAAIEAELDDGEAPVLEEMINTAKEEFVKRREDEMSKLEEAVEAFKSANIPTIEIDSDKTIATVYEEIKFKLREYLEKRENMFEKFHVRPLNDDVLPFYEKSYVYRKSKFETGDPKTPWKLPQNKEYPLIYRSRIYFFKSDEERKQASEVIANLVKRQAKPKDVNTRLKAFIVGRKKTGKSTLAKMLEEKLGLVRIKIKHLLNKAIEFPYWVGNIDIEQVLREGKVPEDDQIIDLLAKRIQMQDCVEKGYVLDGYPYTREQAELLTERGIIPDVVFSMELTRKEVLDRCSKNDKNKDKFGYDNRILHERLDLNDEDLPYTEGYYTSNFNNVKVLNPKSSKWGVFDQAQNIIHDILEQKYNLAIGLITGDPKKVGSLNLTQGDIMASIGEFMNYSPVSLKSQKLFLNSSIFSQFMYYYNKSLYFLGNAKEGEDFAANPSTILQSGLSTELKGAPRRLDFVELVDVHAANKAELKGYCPVNLTKNKVVKGYPELALQYNDRVWYFKSEEELIEFKLNPTKYYKAKLPDKLPISDIQVKDHNNVIKNKALTGEATAYLEHHLGDIAMKVMAQLGNQRLKYPTLSYQETALKFMAIALKSSNPNKSEEYRKKFAEKKKEFMKHCTYAEEVLGEAESRDKRKTEEVWNEWDEENFLKRMEEFHEFMKELKGEDKIEYFKWFIR